MEIKITGKELKITDAINEYVERKLERIDKYFENASAEVTVRTERTAQIAEIVVSANGEFYRAVTEDKDLYASIDKDIDILEGQIRKAKTRREKMLKDSTLKVLEVEQPRNEIKDEILKVEYYDIKPMTPEDAKEFGVENGQIVSVKVENETGRGLIFLDTVIRVSPKYALAMHIDTDEANAGALSGVVTGTLIK